MRERERETESALHGRSKLSVSASLTRSPLTSAHCRYLIIALSPGSVVAVAGPLARFAPQSAVTARLTKRPGSATLTRACVCVTTAREQVHVARTWIAVAHRQLYRVQGRHPTARRLLD